MLTCLLGFWSVQFHVGLIGRHESMSYLNLAQTPGPIQKVNPPQGSVIHAIEALESGVWGSTLWILPGIWVRIVGPNTCGICPLTAATLPIPLHGVITRHA